MPSRSILPWITVEIFVYDPTCSHRSKIATKILLMFESLDGHLKGRNISWSHMLGTQNPFIQGFNASNYQIWLEIYRWDLKVPFERLLRRAWTYIWCFMLKVCSSTTYHILLAKLGELPMELYAHKPTKGFQQRLAHPPSSWLVNQATSLSQNLGEQGFDTLHNLTTIWKAWCTYLNKKPMTTQHHQISHLSISRRLFLLRVELFPSPKEETRLPPPRGFSQIQMWIVLEATIDTTLIQDHCCLLHLKS